jgi:hypothetical protein
LGHERLGFLPKSRRWRDIIGEIASSANRGIDTERVVELTANAINMRLRNLHLDLGVQEAFVFLVLLSEAGSHKAPSDRLTDEGIDLQGRLATPIALSRILATKVREAGQSQENASLALVAASHALVTFYQEHSLQREIFDNSGDPFSVWKQASDGAGFSELTRSFLSNLTAGYLKYFLDREASSVLPTVEARIRFQNQIEIHIDQITRHSDQTAKISQSFAAGWYNKNVLQDKVSRDKANAFLSIALNKIRDSLRRESPQ